MTDEAMADPIAGPIFRHVVDAGYRVNVFASRPSLLGTVPAAYEAHAVDVRTDPPRVHVVKVVRDMADDQALYRLACELAASVGIRIDD